MNVKNIFQDLSFLTRVPTEIKTSTNFLFDIILGMRLLMLWPAKTGYDRVFSLPSRHNSRVNVLICDVSYDFISDICYICFIRCIGNMHWIAFPVLHRNPYPHTMCIRRFRMCTWIRMRTIDEYRQISNIRQTLKGNTTVDHSYVGAAPTTSSFST